MHGVYMEIPVPFMMYAYTYAWNTPVPHMEYASTIHGMRQYHT